MVYKDLTLTLYDGYIVSLFFDFNKRSKLTGKQTSLRGP